MLKSNVKIIFCMLTALFVFSVQMTFSQNTIIDGGNWSDTGNWAGGNIASTTGEDVDTQSGGNPKFSGTETMTVDGDYTTGSITFFDQTLTVDNNNNLVLGSQALFDGGTDKSFTAQNNVTLNINAGASMIIYGDLIVNNNLTLNVTGTLIVKGDLIFNNGGDLVVDGTVEVDGTIDAGNNSTLGGTGTVSAGDCTGDPDVCGDSQLPISLLSFDISLNSAQQVEVKWVTATEENNDYFNIERSRDGVTYEAIATISGAGNSTEAISYEYLDSSPLFGKSYYRLKQTDFDGASETFNAKSVYVSSLSKIVAFPNPVVRGEKLNIYSSAEDGEDVDMSIYSSAGVVVMSRNLAAGNNELILDNQLQAGFYILKVKSGDKQIVKRLLVK